MTILFAVAVILVILDLPPALSPRRHMRFHKWVFRKLRLISQERYERPLRRWRVIAERAWALAMVVVGLTIMAQIPVHIGGALSDDVPARAEAPSDPFAEVDVICSRFAQEGNTVGMSVGAIRGGEMRTFGYGRTRLGGGECPNADTLYEIGSISKTFTATALASMILDGSASLDDPVQKLLPNTVTMPAFEGRAITLLDLVTQTSGLPRMPNNFFHWRDVPTLAFVKTPYASYSVDNLYDFLSHYTLTRAPGSVYEYSNLGVGLLGHALALRASLPYEDLVVAKVCEPLGMHDTRITLSAEQQARLAQGYDSVVKLGGMRVGFAASAWDRSTLAGAGMLRSSVNDMLKYLSANMELSKSPLTPAMELAHELRHDVGPKMKIAMAWHVIFSNDGDPIIWHNGGTGGYRTFAGFSPTHKLGVVVLSNTTTSVDQVATRCIEALAK